MQLEPILISGHWTTPAEAPKTFNAFNPATGEALAALYPVSPWQDLDEMLRAGTEAAALLARTPPETLAGFLEDYANRIQANADELVRIAHIETALAEAPRLRRLDGIEKPVSLSMRNVVGRHVLERGERARVAWDARSLVLFR
jgi:NADP-dependent aldehyde dehydrogenase